MQTILLLHGAIGAKDQLQPLATALEGHYKVHTLDFSGHGKEAFPDTPFSMQMFAEDVLKFMDANGMDKLSIFGYSMGGYVALYLAKHHPERIDKVITLATKFHWDEPIAQKETGMLDPEKIEVKLPAFATTLAQRHEGKDWKQVLYRTAAMLRALGADNTLKTGDYAGIQTPCLILLGDRDKMVGLEETLAVYKELPNAQMGLLPATSHPIEQVHVELLSFFIRRALK